MTVHERSNGESTERDRVGCDSVVIAGEPATLKQSIGGSNMATADLNFLFGVEGADRHQH